MVSKIKASSKNGPCSCFAFIKVGERGALLLRIAQKPTPIRGAMFFGETAKANTEVGVQ